MIQRVARDSAGLCLLLCTLYPLGAGAAYTAKEREVLSKNITKILNTLVNTTTYDKRLRPNYGGDPVDVGITIYVSSISAVSEVEMDYTLDMYLRQMWQDPRLAFEKYGAPVNDLTIDVGYLKAIWDFTLDFYLRQMWTDPRLAFEQMDVATDALTVGVDYIESIWVPDTFFPNEKKSFFHKATTHNSFLRITNKGKVKTSQRLTVTATCPMDLRYFPIDSQECSLEIESYGYSTADIKFRWPKARESVGTADIRLPQFRLQEHMIDEVAVKLSTGEYARLICRFLFVREIGFYMIQIYLPSILIVIISWVSFWLSRDATPARVALGVTTVLTMTTIMTTTNSAMPKVSYVKSIDIYLMTCFLMVFASLLEYAAVGYLNKKLRMLKEENRKKANLSSTQPTTFGPTPIFSPVNSPNLGARMPLLPLHGEGGGSRYRQLLAPASPQMLGGMAGPECDCDMDKSVMKAMKLTPPQKTRSSMVIQPSSIDKYSRLIFPLCFSCFNAIYWVIYLSIAETSLKPNENTILSSDGD